MDKLQNVVDMHRARLKKAGHTNEEAEKMAETVAGLVTSVKSELQELEKSPFGNLLTAAVLGGNCVQLGICELISVPPMRPELECFSAEVRKGIAFLSAALRVADHMLETGEGTEEGA